MSEPTQVPELPGWVFLRGSENPIARQVENYEPGRLRLARYVAKDGDWPDGQLCVMRLFIGDLGHDQGAAPESLETWKAWVICVMCKDPETGDPMTREPDMRILRQLEAFDTWARGRHPKHLQRWAKEVRDKRAARAKEAFRTSMDDRIGVIARQVRRELGHNGRIYVLDSPISKETGDAVQK